MKNYDSPDYNSLLFVYRGGEKIHLSFIYFKFKDDIYKSGKIAVYVLE